MGIFRQFTCWLSLALLFGAVVVAVADDEAELTDAEEAAVLDGLYLDAGRQVYWRGEVLELALRVPRVDGTTVKLVMTNRLNQEVVLADGLMVQAANGQGWLDLLVPTSLMGTGEYKVRAIMPDRTVSTMIYLIDTLAAAPTMVLDESPAERLASIAEVAQLGGNMQWQANGAMPPADLDRQQDVMLAGGVLDWVQPGERALQIVPPYSAENQLAYRRHLMVTTLRRLRYPSYAGSMFDYDPDGFINQAERVSERWQWGPLKGSLRSWLARQEAEYRRAYQERTGLAPLSHQESRDLAVALQEPEILDPRTRPARSWARDVVAYGTPPDVNSVDALRNRHRVWHDSLMDLQAQRYRDFQSELDRLEPGLRHSACLPLGTLAVRDGAYLPGAMSALDFRFMSAWDVAGGEPTHLGQAEFAAAVAGAGRPRQQPLWVTATQGDLNGSLFRTALRLAGVGAQGVGYSFGGGSSLAYADKSDDYLLRNSTRNQEISLTGKLMTRFGGLWAQTDSVRRVGLLFSRRQAIMDGTRLGNAERHYLAYTLLAHSGVAPRIVTEEMLDGDLPRDLQVLIVLGQSERLEPGRELRLRQFAMEGGQVLMDTHSQVPWDFARRSDVLNLPRSLAQHPFIDGRPADRQDGDVMRLMDLLADRVPRLRNLLQNVVRQNPLDSLEHDIMVAELAGGQAVFVAVTNERRLDPRRALSDTERHSQEAGRLSDGTGAGLEGSWLPLQTQLLVSRLPGQGANPTIYNLFAPGPPVVPVERSGSLWLNCDLSGAPGALYAMYPTPVGPGRLLCNQKLPAGLPLNVSYQATTVNQNPLHAVVPIEVELVDSQGAQLWKIFRATDASGAYSEFLPTDRFLGEALVTLRVRNLLDGGGQELDIRTTLDAPLQAMVTETTRVRAPENLRTFLDTKPTLMVPVLDPSHREAATELVARLQANGVDARLDSVPVMLPYPIAYEPTDTTVADRARVDAGEAFGQVRMLEGTDVWHGRHYDSWLPGYRYDRHVVLLGTPGQNPVLDALVASGMVWSPRQPMAPGTALVQHIPLALSPGHDTVVVYAADVAGLMSGIRALITPPFSDAVTSGVRQARQNRLQQRGLPLRTATVQTISDQSSSHGARQPSRKLEFPRFVTTPVVKVEPWGDELLVQLGRWGQSIALVDRDAKVRPLLTINGLTSVGTGPNVLVTGTPTMATAWTRDGRCLWRAMGQFVAMMPHSDMAILERDDQYYVVDPKGYVSRHDANLPALSPEESPYGTRLLLEELGKRTRVTGVVLVDKKSDADVPAVQLTLKRLGRNNFGIEEIIRTGTDGLAAMVFRRYLGVNQVTIYNRGLKRVFPLKMSTRYLTDGDVSEDERWLAIAGMEGNVLIYDLAGVPAQSAQVGAFPMITPLPAGGFVIVSSDGRLALMDAEAEHVRTVDLITALGPLDAEATFAAMRAGKLVELEPVSRAVPDPSLTLFRPAVYADPSDLATADWARPVVPLNGPTRSELDFRFMDRASAELDFREGRMYRITIRAAARPWAARPQASTVWQELIDWRQAAVSQQPARPGRFQIYVDGLPVGSATPEGGSLRPWVDQDTATDAGERLRPTTSSLTTFVLDIELTAGRHRLGIEAVDMQDVLVRILEIR